MNKLPPMLPLPKRKNLANPYAPSGTVYGYTADQLTAYAESERQQVAAAKDAEVALWKETVHDEIAANLALRELGGALPDEDMPTFLRRVIAERDALAARVAELLKYRVGELPLDGRLRDCDESRKALGELSALIPAAPDQEGEKA